MTEDQVPSAAAIPAHWTAKIPKVAPGTHNKPDTSPHGVHTISSPAHGSVIECE